METEKGVKSDTISKELTKIISIHTPIGPRDFQRNLEAESSKNEACLEYIIGDLLKKNSFKNWRIYSNHPEKELSLQEVFDQNITQIVLRSTEQTNTQTENLSKSANSRVIHKFGDKSLTSYFYTNGKKTHSTEMNFDILVRVLETRKSTQQGSKGRENLARGGSKFHKNPKNQEAQITFNNMVKNQAPIKKYGGSISLEELSNHHKIGDCWTAIDGRVYDITNYIKYHPGGKKILLGAGKDGTQLFYKYHAWVNIEFILGKYCLGMLE